VKIVRVRIHNFRGIRNLDFCPQGSHVLIGQVNSGKSTILNALALVLDPEYGRRYQAVEESDFLEMKLKDADGNPIPIGIEVTLADLTREQEAEFADTLELWDLKKRNRHRQLADYLSVADVPAAVATLLRHLNSATRAAPGSDFVQL
jgi:predicted ATP-dependent endonuclease of OLD family